MNKTTGLSLILLCLAGEVGASSSREYGDFPKSPEIGKTKSYSEGNGLTVQLNSDQWGTGRVALIDHRGEMVNPDVIEDRTVNPGPLRKDNFGDDD